MLFQRFLRGIGAGLCLLALTACTALAPETPQASPTASPSPTPQGRAFVLGDISDDPGEVIEGTQPLADYLAKHLQEYGITEGQVHVATTSDEMVELLKSGAVDLYCDSVYPATLISDASGAQPILRRWRFGVEAYHSIIFTTKESGIASLAELPGHFIAFDNPLSTSGYVLPAVYLTERGVNLVGKSGYDQAVGADEVGFVFSYDDENTLQWLLSGMVAAGVTDDYYFNVTFPADVREKLLVLAETDYVPRQVVVARPGLDPQLLTAIKQLLTTAHENEEGQAALEPFQTSRFDEFPEGIETAQNRMRAMMAVVKGIPLP